VLGQDSEGRTIDLEDLIAFDSPYSTHSFSLYFWICFTKLIVTDNFPFYRIGLHQKHLPILCELYVRSYTTCLIRYIGTHIRRLIAIRS